MHRLHFLDSTMAFVTQNETKKGVVDEQKRIEDRPDMAEAGQQAKRKRPVAA